MRKIEQGTVAVSLDEKSLMVTLEQEKTKWSWKEGFRPYMECEEGELFFDEAASISHETYQTESESEVYFLILKKKEKNIHTVLKH